MWSASCKRSSSPFHSCSVLDRGCLKEGEHCSSHARATRKSLTISWPKWRHEMAWQILRGHYHDLCRLQRGSTAHPALQRSTWPRPRPVVERVTGDFAASERRPASRRTGAGPDGRADSTTLRPAARTPPACAPCLMHSTRAHGAEIAAWQRIRRSPPQHT